MSDTNNTVKHDGTILKIENGIVYVRIIVAAACDSCNIKSACGIAEMKEKIIEVKDYGRNYQPGEKVVVSMKAGLGLRATFFAYFLPFIIVFVSLILTINILQEEGIAAGISLACLAVYYLILYFFKDHLKKVFTYKIDN